MGLVVFIWPLAPAQILILERNRSMTLACSLEYRVADRWRNLSNSFLARSRDPAIRLEERDIDLFGILVHARDLELVEVVFDSSSVLDRSPLVHRVVISPVHLSFKLLSHC